METSTVALWLVCGLGGTVFAAMHPWSRRMVVTGGMVFLLGAWWAGHPSAPSLSMVACGVAIVSGMWLVRAGKPIPAALAAALLAGLSLGALESSGLPRAWALAVGALAPAAPFVAAFRRTRHPDFAPSSMLEEALLFLLVFGLVAAAAPIVMDGWRAAGHLQVNGGEAASAAAAAATAIPTWTLSLSCLALLGGGLYSLWSRR